MSVFSLWTIRAGWIVTSMLVGLVVVFKAANFFFASGDYNDPFGFYDTILPGNAISELSRYDYLVTEARVNGRINPVYFSCAILSPDRYFDIIHVEGRNEVISEVTFYAKDVRFGQPLLHWKPPAYRKVKDNSMESNTGLCAILNYQIPIRIFTIKGVPEDVE
jgi:hypothetical protein